MERVEYIYLSIIRVRMYVCTYVRMYICTYVYRSNAKGIHVRCVLESVRFSRFVAGIPHYDAINAR